MNGRVVEKCTAFLLCLVTALNASASIETVGPNGINSSGLGLSGDGILIGQVESVRPGLPGFDNASNSNSSTVPAAVFIENGIIDPTANAAVEIFSGDPPIAHATWVAGVMIGNDPLLPGVAGDADLYASLASSEPMAPGNPGWALDEKLAMAAQHVATLNGGNVRAINQSSLITLPPGGAADGNSLLTLLVDWLAGADQHDTLYVVGWRQIGLPNNAIVPADNFNGMTVAASSEFDGTYRRVAAFNLYDQGLTGGRTAVDIIAPGESVLVPDVGEPDPLPQFAIADGTSIAAPHVTGTVALLQEHAATQMPGNANARRHEVMKAVLMNSADKIKDDGTRGPMGAFLGMERTVLRQHEEGQPDEDWFDSSASFSPFIALDEQMGAGHLNAKRALDQFSPGESNPGPVPLVGWDYESFGDDDVYKYVIQGNLVEDSYISATLVWDRDVFLNTDLNSNNAYDPGDEFGVLALENWDLHIVPAGTTDIDTATWKASSTADEMHVEHIFDQIPETGQYEIWVVNANEFFPSGPYALAWWATDMIGGEGVPGDYDGNGSVGPEDYDLWQADFGDAVAAGTGADGNGDGIVNAADYVIWRKEFETSGSGSGLAAVPEPASMVLLALAGVVLGARKRKELASFSSTLDVASA